MKFETLTLKKTCIEHIITTHEIISQLLSLHRLTNIRSYQLYTIVPNNKTILAKYKKIFILKLCYSLLYNEYTSKIIYDAKNTLVKYHKLR